MRRAFLHFLIILIAALAGNALVEDSAHASGKRGNPLTKNVFNGDKSPLVKSTKRAKTKRERRHDRQAKRQVRDHEERTAGGNKNFVKKPTRAKSSRSTENASSRNVNE